MPYTKEEKWSHMMKRVINDKTKNQNYFSTSTEQLGK